MPLTAATILFPLLPAFVFGSLVGLSLGLLGGGGSILALPLLIYGLGVDVHVAILGSLMLVGLIAAGGAVRYSMARQVLWKPALLMAASGVIVTPLVLRWAHGVPDSIRLSLFALAMLAAVASMLRPIAKRNASLDPEAGRGWIQLTPKALISGIVAGSFAGFFGIGGGFVIVPLLVQFLRLPYAQAVATSLAVISLISLSGVAGELARGIRMPLALFILFAAGGLSGMLISIRFVTRWDERSLRRLFAAGVTLLAVFILVDTLILK